MAQFSISGVILDGTGSTSTPARQDLTFPQGEDVVFKLTVVGGSGAAFNITGYSGTMLWKTSQSIPSSPILLSLPLTLTSPTSGQGTFTLPAGTSKGFNQSMFFYDVFITSGSGAKDEVVPTSLITLNYAVGM